MSNIISASRRTDVPAFYSEWFLRRLEEGFCDYWQPFAHQWFQVSLRPEEVAGIVLWTKNLGPLLPSLPALRQRYVFYVQFTITGHPRALEPGIIPTAEAVEQLQEVSRQFGPDSVVWRFDPIVYTQHGGPTETLERFDRLSKQLEGYTRRCTISFMSPYRRQQKAFAQAGLQHTEPTPAERRGMAAELGARARAHGMELSACCNEDVLSETVTKAHCVDADLLRALGADLPRMVSPAPSRKGCGCMKSIDIGAYDLCPGGCAYCYANQDHDLARRNWSRHSPGHHALAEATIPRKDQDPR